MDIPRHQYPRQQSFYIQYYAFVSLTFSTPNMTNYSPVINLDSFFADKFLIKYEIKKKSEKHFFDRQIKIRIYAEFFQPFFMSSFSHCIIAFHVFHRTYIYIK